MLELTEYEALKIKKMCASEKRMRLGKRLFFIFLMFIMLFGVVYLNQQYMVIAVIYS